LGLAVGVGVGVGVGVAVGVGVGLGIVLRSLITIFNAGDVFLFLNTSVGTGISSMELQEIL